MATPKELTKKQRREVVEYIINEIALSSLSLRKATLKAAEHFKLDKLPLTTAYWWIEMLGYTEQYARAMEQRAENIFEEILDIADCEDHDIIIDEDGNKRVNYDVIQRDRLRVDARRWMLGKMQPKKYGDKVDVTSDGEKVVTTVINLGSGVKPLEDE